MHVTKPVCYVYLPDTDAAAAASDVEAPLALSASFSRGADGLPRPFRSGKAAESFYPDTDSSHRLVRVRAPTASRPSHRRQQTRAVNGTNRQVSQQDAN